jgi:hypothetical protein
MILFHERAVTTWRSAARLWDREAGPVLLVATLLALLVGGFYLLGMLGSRSV